MRRDREVVQDERFRLKSTVYSGFFTARPPGRAARFAEPKQAGRWTSQAPRQRGGLLPQLTQRLLLNGCRAALRQPGPSDAIL